MKRIWIGALGLTLAMVMGACGSDKTPAATVTDAAVATDTGGASDAGNTTDAGEASDAGKTTDAGEATDAGKTTDTGNTTPDTSSAPTKCDSSDNACLQACGTKKCVPEMTGCNQDKGCSNLITCLNGCAQGIQPPKPTTAVSMPDGTTPTTCQDFCVVAAGTPAYNKLSTMQICIQGKCIKSVPGKTDNCVPKTPNYNNCISTCVTIKCTSELTTCNGSQDCSSVLGCLTGCKNDQTCTQSCQLKATAKGTQEFNALVGCLKSFCIKQ